MTYQEAELHSDLNKSHENNKYKGKENESKIISKENLR